MREEQILTAEELADYMKVNETTVLELARLGELPGFKVGDQWRFSWTVIDRYIQSHVFDAPQADLDLILSTKERLIPFSRLTEESLIDLDMHAENKKQVMSHLARMSNDNRLTPSYESLYVALEEREKLLSTAVGQGVAIPHPRFPDKLTFKEPHIIIARSKAGVDYGAPDNKKVHLFFLPCAQSQFVHLRLVAKISKLLHIPDVIPRLMRIQNPRDIIQILVAFEQQHLLPFDNICLVSKVIREQEQSE